MNRWMVDIEALVGAGVGMRILELELARQGKQRKGMKRKETRDGDWERK